MNSAQIRQSFLDFFANKGHEVVASSPLIPANDPTLLFTNAGMVQFKEVFLGLDKRPYHRAATAQRCVRAGGKHNDLENVGYTARHHTFFEMLGNFSFGDYFKREAIQFAWEYLTEVLNIPAEKLWVTVFEEDQEAEDIWLKEMKVSAERFSRCGAKDNFWSMGDTGPCGPCSEIFYDHGPDVAGGPPGTPEEDGDRYVEIWNLVFMQFNRDASGELTPLPKPSVDTGMGLERVAAVMQNVHSNYDIDLFQHLINEIAKLGNIKDKSQSSLKVIADHIRSSAFLMVDGVIPSNEGRGYVLRRIIRRAIRHGNKLGFTNAFFYKLVQPLVDEMGEAYPELRQAQSIIEKILLQEEEQFAKTLEQGLKILESDIAQLSDNNIPGETIFKLYDTYGFPVDLTGDIARERGLVLDMQGFDAAMQAQREQSQAASGFAGGFEKGIQISGQSEFVGYELNAETTKVTHLLREGVEVKRLTAGEAGAIVLAVTPFYPEGGGQVGDSGVIEFADARFQVTDTQKSGDAIIHIGRVEHGTISVDDAASASIDASARDATRKNHSATHLLHAALRQVLGEHVRQKGSLVEPKRLRFDFMHYEAVTPEELKTIETLVNQKIQDNIAVETNEMTPDAAQAAGALALFGEKYGEKVRVLGMGDFSKELCGGTHVRRTGDIGLLKIISETGIAAGIRRIEAVTGQGALHYVNTLEEQLDTVASVVKSPRDKVAQKVSQLLNQNKQLEKDIEQLKAKLTSSKSADLVSQAQNIDGIHVLAVRLDGAEPKSLRGTLDQLKNKLGSAVIVLVGVNDGRVNVVAGISKDCIGKVPAPSDLVAQICGKGGGRDDMAQGGGQLPSDLDARLARITTMVKEAL